MRFSDVVGQASPKAALLHAVASGRLPHALLLLGPEGTGGLPMAVALAQYLFCEAPGAEDSCGTCPACHKVQRLEHADLHFSFPIISHDPPLSRAFIGEFRDFVRQTPYGTAADWLHFIGSEGKGGNISAKECRQMIDDLTLRAYEGGRRVLVLWRPEYLGREGNILLKLIEEPPTATTLIFVAEAAEDILATIRSRVQTVRLPPLPPDVVSAALLARGGIAESAAGSVAAASGGSYSTALRILRTTDAELFPLFRDLFNAVFRHNTLGLVRTADTVAKDGREGAIAFLHYGIGLLEAALRARHAPDVPLRLPAAEEGFVRKLAAARISDEGLAELAQASADAAYRIERNAHLKAQLLAAGIRMSQAVAAGPHVAA